MAARGLAVPSEIYQGFLIGALGVLAGRAPRGRARAPTAHV